MLVLVMVMVEGGEGNRVVQKPNTGFQNKEA